MKKKSYGWAFAFILASLPAYAGDFGFPTLNTAGRYFGVGWSHHTYHSQVDGRYNVITNRHPACAYPSSSLSQFYSSDYENFPARPIANNSNNGFWRAPTVLQPSIVDPKAAETKPNDSKKPKNESSENLRPRVAPRNPSMEELEPPKAIDTRPKDPPRPKEPPPTWLKPYLENEKNKVESDLIELEPSPNDGKHATAPLNRYRR